MAVDPRHAPFDSRAWRWAARLCGAVAVLAWLLLVLRDQYGVVSLQAYQQASLDGLFLVGLVGAAVARALGRRSPAARRIFVLRLVLVVGTTAMSVAAAEYLARFEFRGARTSGNVGDFIGRTNKWSPGPSNSLGFREREIPPKSSARYRIVVIGDSFAWGQGIERNERFSDLLQQSLGPGYEVFNFAIPGDNMPEHLIRLDRALTVSPDFILLEIYTNDFETTAMVRPRSYPLLPQSLDERLMRSSLFYVLLQRQWMHVQELVGISESYARYMAQNLQDPNAPNARKAYGQLHEFFYRARLAGVPAGAVLFPATDELGRYGAAYPFGYLHRGVQKTCAEEWVPCLDLLPMFSRFPDVQVTWVSPVDAHPNALANRLAANEILQSFRSVWRH
jgi:lysophospholipase L1-like esterase